MQLQYPPHIRSLRASLTGTRKALAAHRKLCADCSRAHVMRMSQLSCGTGWAWCKDESRFIRKLERAGHPELISVGDQLALF